MSFKIEGKIKGLMPGDTLSFERITLPGFSRNLAFNVIVETQDEFSYSGSHEQIGYYAMTYKPISGKVIRSDRMGMRMLIENGTTRIIGSTTPLPRESLRVVYLQLSRDAIARQRGKI